jgi:hypothetical protein
LTFDSKKDGDEIHYLKFCVLLFAVLNPKHLLRTRTE